MTIADWYLHLKVSLQMEDSPLMCFLEESVRVQNQTRIINLHFLWIVWNDWAGVATWAMEIPDVKEVRWDEVVVMEEVLASF
jgi:hypothetical protein